MAPGLMAFICTVSAGIMNGSFALPTKYVKNWNFENIWLSYAFWAFIVLPWATLFILDPQAWHVYHMAPPYSWLIIVLGGFLFGAGQICFALALNTIGIGLGFVLNIGLATGLGFLLPLVFLHAEDILTSFGFITLCGILFIIAGLLLSYVAGRQRNVQTQVDKQPHKASKRAYCLGVFLAVLGGVFSAGQNFTFALTANLQQMAMASGVTPLAAAIIIWPVFLLCTFIPYMMYMIYLHSKHDSFRSYRNPGFKRNQLFAVTMAVLWYLSLVAYSQAALMIGRIGPVVIWPLFMVLIILTSSFWGWKSKEWTGCSMAIKRNAIVAIALLAVAVIILAYSATLSP